jgi:thioredoxin 1
MLTNLGQTILSQEDSVYFCKIFFTKPHNTPSAGMLGETMGQVRAVTDAEFESSVKGDEWVLVDFWAPWCGPCKAIAPVLEQVAGERDILIAKVNTDTNSANAGRLGVRGIPALFLYHNGNVVSKQSGAMPKPKLLKWIDEHMNANDF